MRRGRTVNFRIDFPRHDVLARVDRMILYETEGMLWHKVRVCELVIGAVGVGMRVAGEGGHSLTSMESIMAWSA